MKKKVLSALTATLILGAVTQSAYAAPDTEVVEVVPQQNSDSQINAELRDLRARIADLEREQNYQRRLEAEREAERAANPNWTDKFKLNGELRYRFWHDKKVAPKGSNNQLQLRLLPTIQLNDNLAIKARFTSSFNHMENDGEASWATNFAYVEGKFDNFKANVGKMPLYTNVDKGMIADDFFSGVQLVTDFDAINLAVNAGDWDVIGNYAGVEAIYSIDDDTKAGVGYHHFQEHGTKINLVSVGGEMKFNEDFGLNAAYAHNDKGGTKKYGYNVEGTYLGAKRDEPSSWGAFLAYRYVPSSVGVAPTYDSFGQSANKKGVDLGATYTPIKDSLLKVSYFHGKTFSKVNSRTLFARASLFF